MTAFPSYATGTVSVNAGDTQIVGVGTIWSGANARAGDDIVVAGHTVIVQDVIDATHIAIDAWPFSNVAAGTAYKIVQRSPLRFVGGQAMADVSALVAALNSDGFFVFVDPAASAPDPSLGSNGQYAFQPNTRKYWIKSGGAWVFQGQPGIGDLIAANALSELSGVAATARNNIGAQAALGYTPLNKAGDTATGTLIQPNARVQGASPIIDLLNTGGGTNLKNFRWINAGNNVVAQGLNDGYSAVLQTFLIYGLSDGSITVGAGGLKRTPAPAGAWDYDVSAGAVVSNGAAYFLQSGAGLWLFTDMSFTGQTALYTMGGGQVIKVAGGASFTASADGVANTMSVNFDGSGTYYLRNNMGGPLTVGHFSVRTRPTA